MFVWRICSDRGCDPDGVGQTGLYLILMTVLDLLVKNLSMLSQKVCLISRKIGPTPVCRPGICSLGVFKPLNIQTMEFTKVQISEIIRKHADLKFSIDFASSLLWRHVSGTCSEILPEEKRLYKVFCRTLYDHFL